MDDKDRVKEATDIVELVGSYVQLRRDGASFKCCCPWHADKRPSMTVNPALGLWKCWVCDIGGDCFEWVMKQEACDFPTSVEILAEKAGIKLERIFHPKSQKRRSILEVMEVVTEKFEAAITGQCLDYLSDRKISKESIKRWRLGSCIPFDRLGLEEQLLIDAGVVGVSGQGRKYDRFGGRLIFPIADAQGRVIAMGGRVLPGQSDKLGKYINSPETDLFKKSKTLYGLRNARDGIRRRKSVIVMEGYTDVIIAHQAGVDNAVACLGTAFTEEHVRQLTTVADKIIIVLDGDEAGQKRSDAIVDVLVKSGTPSQLVTIPGGDDPADWILKFGAKAFDALVARAVEPIQFRIKRICKDIDPKKQSAEASAALNAVLDLLVQCEIGVVEMSTGVIALQFGIPEAVVLRRMAEKVRARAKKGDLAESVKLRTASKIDIEDRLFISMLILHQESVQWFQEKLDPSWLTNDCRAVWSVFDYAEREGNPLDWQSVCQSLPSDSKPKVLIEAVATWIEMSAACGSPVPVPKSSVEAQQRIDDMVRAYEAVRGDKEDPFADLF